MSLFFNRRDQRTWYFIYMVLACLALYLAGPAIGLLDIRLIPFIQLYLTMFGATLLLPFLNRLKFLQLVPIIIFIAVILWVAPNVRFTKSWINWNYSGLEGKNVYPLLQEITGHLAKTKSGRVVYEHSPAHNIFGSERIFENLPYLAGRETLEGLYMQSSISSPFIFYIQSEVSKVCSGPFPQYQYTSLNIAQALKHLKMFNVTQYIARSEQAKNMARQVPQLELEKTFGDYEIYRFTDNDGSYVVPLKFEPVLFQTDNWKKDFHEWFRNNEINDVFLIYSPNLSLGNDPNIKYETASLKDIPKVPIVFPPGGKVVSEEVKDDEISFNTDLLHYPHLIKVSYHPNWQVEGAGRIYLVSPSLMLVYPEQHQVRLYFGKTVYNYLGEALSLVGLSIVLISGIICLVHVRKT